MSTATTAIFFLTVGLLLNCCGCPTPPGGDPTVWQDVSINGLAELDSVETLNDGGTQVSIRFTYEDGRVDERPIEGLKLTSIHDLPAEYEPNVGDQLRLRLDLRYQRKMSVGPPEPSKSPNSQPVPAP